MNHLCWKAEWAPLARRFSDCLAVEDASGPVSYAALYAAAAGVASRLREAGPQPGQAIASILPNGRHAVAASLGIALAGATEAPINPALAPAEVEHCLRLAGARRAITTRDLVPALSSLGVELLAADELEASDLEALPEARVGADSWARILFTSGTTGRPKGIVHSQGGRWIANLLLRATLPVAPTPGRRILLVTPYAHGAGLLTQAFLDGGAAVRLLPGLDAGLVVGILEHREVDQVFAPPTVLAKLVAALEGRRIDGIDAIFCGTAPLSPELYARARAIFGPVVRVTYGKTEIVNPITVLTPAETDRWYAEPGAGESICVGWPASGVEVTIGAGDDPAEPGGEAGPAAPAGPRVGPVLVRARHMLAAVLTEEGIAPHDPEAFHRTGDLGFLDGRGRLHLVGREADVIKTGGYRVTPEEVEAALRPGLGGGELVVVGLPSEYWGEVITVAAAGVAAGWRERLAPLIARLTRYKQPRLFAEVPEVSRNALGKVVRARVREAVLARYDLADGRYPKLVARQTPRSGC